MYLKNLTGILIGITLNLYVNLEIMDVKVGTLFATDEGKRSLHERKPDSFKKSKNNKT